MLATPTQEQKGGEGWREDLVIFRRQTPSGQRGNSNTDSLLKLEQVLEQSLDGEDGRQEVKATFPLLPTLSPPHPLLQSIPDPTDNHRAPSEARPGRRDRAGC